MVALSLRERNAVMRERRSESNGARQPPLHHLTAIPGLCIRLYIMNVRTQSIGPLHQNSKHGFPNASKS
jgi:hypothetical protein